jgi:hypothetical protein
MKLHAWGINVRQQWLTKQWACLDSGGPLKHPQDLNFPRELNINASIKKFKPEL